MFACPLTTFLFTFHDVGSLGIRWHRQLVRFLRASCHLTATALSWIAGDLAFRISYVVEASLTLEVGRESIGVSWTARVASLRDYAPVVLLLGLFHLFEGEARGG